MEQVRVAQGSEGGGRRACCAILAVLAVLALTQFTGCAGFRVPEEGDLLFNAKRFDHFTCVNLTLMAANVRVELYDEDGRLFDSHDFPVGAMQTGGFVLALERLPPVAIRRVVCSASDGQGQTGTCILETDPLKSECLHSATFWWGTEGVQSNVKHLSGSGVLYLP